jgi:hypothetical protein
MRVCFLFFSFLFANVQGRVGKGNGIVPEVKLCDRRFPLGLDGFIRPKVAKRGRPQIWKEIVTP